MAVDSFRTLKREHARREQSLAHGRKRTPLTPLQRLELHKQQAAIKARAKQRKQIKQGISDARERFFGDLRRR